MLPAKGYTDDRNAKQQSKKEVVNGNPNPTTYYPDDIGKSLQAAPARIVVHHFSPKRPKHEFC